VGAFSDKMLLKFPCGKDFVKTEIPEENLELAVSRPSTPLTNLKETVKKALRKPIQSKPLHSLLDRKKNLCIIVPDVTRACPTEEILPPILDELEICAPNRIEILIGNGLHRSISNKEMVELLGEGVVKEYNIINHVATDEGQLVNLGAKTSYGTPAVVNRVAAKSDALIGIGLVEPHFFAGYSGGRKTVLPAVAGEKAIFNNHSYKMMDHPKASYGILDGNPIHKDMVEFMKFVNLLFIVNVTINNKGETTGVFAGHPIKAHMQAVDYLNRFVEVKLQDYGDIVITSNGGYPLDRDLYQSVKGMATAERVVKKKGVIIIVAECREGLGGHEEFRRLMEGAKSPKEVLKKIRENEPITDQWQAQVMARVLEKARVVTVTEGVKDEVIRNMMMEPASSLEEALDFAKKVVSRKKPRIIAIPEGPYVIPQC
jgi:nickel-dependent lactate racemase